MRCVCRTRLDRSSLERPVQYSELEVLVRGREARKRKESREICSPTSLLEYGARAEEALSNAETFVDGGAGYSSIPLEAMRCAKPPWFSAKAKKDGGRKE